MSEHFKTYTENEAREYTRIFRAIGEKGLQQIDAEYGPGFDDNKLSQVDEDTIDAFISPWNSPMFRDSFLFHNGRHGDFVGDESREDMIFFGVPEPYVSLAEALARVHDRIRTSGIVLNEQESAQWFNRELELYSDIIPREDIERFQATSNEVNEGTIPVLRGAQLIGQHATEQTYTSKINKLIAYDVSSNDLGEKFRSTGPLMSHLWNYELCKGEPTHEQLIEFETSQVAMDNEYQHPLAIWDEGWPHISEQFIQRKFTPYRNAVIAHSTQVLHDLKRGELQTQLDVLCRDVAFHLDCVQGKILPDFQNQ